MKNEMEMCVVGASAIGNETKGGGRNARTKLKEPIKDSK